MKRLFRNWDVLRVIRLLSGAVFAAYGIYASDSLMIVLGGLLMLMAMVNWSCCAAGGCGTSSGNKALYKDFVKPYQAQRKVSKHLKTEEYECSTFNQSRFFDKSSKL